tara:strand:- start:1283 stop:1837 length:555 start_codon:yes stop_codon:yes gene_type:complete
MSYDKADMERRMKGAVDNLHKEFSGLRTGRASSSMLEGVQVDVYGSKMPLIQVGNVSVPEPRMLTVTVWDGSNVAAVEKAIRNAGLGLNPMSEGSMIRVPVPDLSEERRAELVKVAGKYAENARVSIRNVRKDMMDGVKKMEKDKEVSEDEAKRLSDEVQKVTDSHIEQVDQMLGEKEKDIMQV